MRLALTVGECFAIITNTEGEAAKNMKRILVIGCPGSGKSTFARALQEKTGLPLHHLDLLYWNADKTTVEREVFLSRLHSVLEADAWIIDGNYASTMEERLAACDTVFFLDYDTEICLCGIRERCGKSRSDMPWVETEEDADFTAFVRDFAEYQRPRIYALLDRFKEKRSVVFRSRSEADAFFLRTFARTVEE